MTEPDAFGVLRDRVEGFLRRSLDTVTVDRDGDFLVPFEQVSVWVRVQRAADREQGDQTIVLIWSVAVVGMEVTPELTSYLATEGEKLDFGQFELHEDVVPRIQVSHALLAEYLSREELKVAVESVAGASQHYGAWVRTWHGGTAPWRLIESDSTPSVDVHEEPSEEVSDEEEFDEEWDARVRFSESRAEEERFRERIRTKRRRRLQGTVQLLGLAAGVVAGFYARSRTSSWALAIFVFFVAFWLGFGLSMVVARPRRWVRRFAYYATGPVVATAVLLATHRLWGRWWLSVILAVPGALIGVAAGNRLFPSIAQEELEAAA